MHDSMKESRLAQEGLEGLDGQKRGGSWGDGELNNEGGRAGCDQ